MSDHEPPPPDELPLEGPAGTAPNKLFRSGLALLIAGLIYYALFAQVREGIHLILGLLMFVLAIVPALAWTRRQHTQIPIFAILTLTTLNTYALPLLNGHQDLLRYSADTITLAATAVILFQATMIVVHRMLRVEPGLGDFYEREIIDDRSRPWLIGGIFVVTLYVVVERFTFLIPREFASVLRALLSGVGMICNFVCLRNWGRGTLSAPTRTLIVVLISLQVLVQFSSLVMISGISVICLGLIGYVSGSQRIPYVFIALLLPLLAILHNGKSEMRGKYWSSGNTPATETLTISTLPEFFSQWISCGLQPGTETNAPRSEELTARLIDRSSLFHMLCLVAHYTPARQPFMGGETYLDIPAQFVPRFLWPDKPLSHTSTTKLSVYYGLQREEDTEKTTIGFGLLPEAYANFGLPGIFGLAVFFGTLFKWVELRTSQSPLLSLGGIFLIIMTAWSFQTELPLSMWLSSLAQACTAVLLLPMLYRKLFG